MIRSESLKHFSVTIKMNFEMVQSFVFPMTEEKVCESVTDKYNV